MTTTIEIGAAPLTLSQLRAALNGPVTVSLTDAAWTNVEKGAATVAAILDEGRTVYGINTGFGLLANTSIAVEDLETLQKNLVLSHACGVGEPLSADTTRLLMVLKIASLSKGASGVRRHTLETLIGMVNAEILPLIPSKGSVGASGDLAPLAHMSCVLIGVSEARYQGQTLDAVSALAKAGLKPVVLGPKEGLALLNGTQCSTALALTGLFAAEDVFAAAIAAGGLSVDALLGSDAPFDPRIHALRGQPLPEDGRVAGGDAGTGQLRRPLPLPLFRHRQHQPALAEAQPAQRVVGIRQADLATCRSLLVQLVAADDAEVADAVGDQAGDVVVAHQQQVHRQRFAVAEQLVAALAPAQATGTEQVAGGLGQPATLLDGDTQPVSCRRCLGCTHGGGLEVRNGARISAKQGGRWRRHNLDGHARAFAPPVRWWSR